MQVIITVASVVGALTVIGGFFYGIHKILKKFEMIEGLKQENGLMIKSIFAICDGLHQLGANGIVTKTRDELQDYIIKN
jgi:hypothetical protein